MAKRRLLGTLGEQSLGSLKEPFIDKGAVLTFEVLAAKWNHAQVGTVFEYPNHALPREAVALLGALALLIQSLRDRASADPLACIETEDLLDNWSGEGIWLEDPWVLASPVAERDRSAGPLSALDPPFDPLRYTVDITPRSNSAKEPSIWKSMRPAG